MQIPATTLSSHSRFARLLTQSGGVTCILVAVATPSMAQPATGPGQPPPPGSLETSKPNTPGFATLDRANGDSFIEGTISFASFEGEDPDFNFRTELYGQYIAPSGAGGYASIPFALIGDDDETASGIAHIELGGIYNIATAPNTQWVLRGGVLVNPSDDRETFAANLFTSQSRLTDFISVAPDSKWVRLAVSPLHRSGQFFLRADGGLDVNVDAPEGVDPDPIMRINVGAGVDTGTLAFAGELATVGTTGEVSGDGERFLHTLALSMRGGRTSGHDTFLSIIMPLDDDSFVNVAVMAGLRFPLGG